MFLEKGYAVLLPDSRGHGESGGETISYGVIEKWDVIEWTRWLQGSRLPGCLRPWGIDGSRHSAPSPAEQPAFFAPSLRVPVREPPVDRRRPDRSSASPDLRLPAGCGPHRCDRRFWYARLRYRLDLDAAAPERSVERLRHPVLLIQGSRDTNVSPAHARAIAASAEA